MAEILNDHSLDYSSTVHHYDTLETLIEEYEQEVDSLRTIDNHQTLPRHTMSKMNFFAEMSKSRSKKSEKFEKDEEVEIRRQPKRRDRRDFNNYVRRMFIES